MRCSCTEGDHIFCKGCIEAWIEAKSRPKCPLNNSKGISKKTLLVSTITRNVVAELMLKCKECGATDVKIKDSWKHKELICPNTKTPCQYASKGCTELVKRGEMIDHLDKCDWKKVTCAHCFEWSGYRKDLGTHIDTHRPQWVLQECTLCGSYVRKCDLDDGSHRKHNCPEAEIDCQYKITTGCAVRMKRRQIAKHHRGVKQHLTMGLKTLLQIASDASKAPKALEVTSKRLDYSKFCGVKFRLLLRLDENQKLLDEDDVELDTAGRVGLYLRRPEDVSRRDWSLKGVSLQLIGDDEKVLISMKFSDSSVLDKEHCRGWHSFMSMTDFRDYRKSNSALYFNVMFSEALQRDIAKKPRQ